MSETEITVQCFDSKEKINNQLIKQGWTIKEVYQLNDWYFSAKSLDELKTFDYANLISNSFLVRQIKEKEKDTIQLCYKSKEINEQNIVLSETKTQTKIDSLDNALACFDLAGLTMWCDIRNSSCVYKKNGQKLIVQDIANLGVFIEAEEYEEIKHLSAKEKFTHLVQMVKSINLVLGKDFSCKKAFMKFKQDN